VTDRLVPLAVPVGGVETPPDHFEILVGCVPPPGGRGLRRDRRRRRTRVLVTSDPLALHIPWKLGATPAADVRLEVQTSADDETIVGFTYLIDNARYSKYLDAHGVPT
jgi:hypothetical protein